MSSVVWGRLSIVRFGCKWFVLGWLKNQIRVEIPGLGAERSGPVLDVSHDGWLFNPQWSKDSNNGAAGPEYHISNGIQFGT